jgi:serine/threonine protein kinase
VDPADAELDDPRVFQAVQEYLAALESGHKPDRDRFIAERPEIAAALTECLAGLDLVHTATPKLREPALAQANVEPPTALGDFRIVRELGRGGMGVVYEAVQLSLGRRVALKVLPFASALDARQLQRFKTEAQAAAHLHHQNIVPVYAVGVERGVHFYAMQLIDGQNLAAVVDGLRRQHHPASATRHEPASAPTGDLTVIAPEETRANLSIQFSTLRTERPGGFFRTIAKLVAQAAEALEYAHENGIVHRDIKPANLLIDARGNLWITDFGLAQVQADASLTQTGDLLGTLRYMSPEQAGGPRGLIDHRTDVYSLGATLYELLTLRPIFDGADRRTLLHQIMHEEPKPPRAIDRSIPLDLETIVLKAIGKLPSDRYATARDLADDLNRFLRDEPIRARRATVVQRMRKWLRRHPSVPAAAVVLLLAITAVSIGSALLVNRAYDAERQRAREAQDRLRLARRSVDDILQTTEQELGDNPMNQGLRKKMLEWALGYYQEFLQQESDDPEFKADLAATRDRIQTILADLAVIEGSGQFILLKVPDVLDDLEAGQEQRERLKVLNELSPQRMDQFRDLGRQSPEERRARLAAFAKENDAQVRSILRPDQMARLHQIDLQVKPGVFRDADVIAALKLTPEQQDRIRLMEADRMFGPRMEGPGGPRKDGFRGDGRGGPKKNFDGPHGPDTERVLAILTEDQRQRWKELTGRPYTGRRPFGGPGGRFGGPPAGPPPDDR